MITKYFLLVIALCFSTSNMLSQEIDILGTIQENVGEYNESRGIEDESDGENRELSEDEQRQLDEFWEEKLGDSMDFINGIDKPNHQCLALIGLFSYQMIALQQGIEEAETCQMKYDLMGMQLLMLIGGTTIMPCTEEIYNLDSSGRQELMIDFLSSLYTYETEQWSPGDERPLADEGFPVYLRFTDLAKKAEGAAKQIYIGFFTPYPPPPPGDSGWTYEPDMYDYDNLIKKMSELYFEPRSLVYNIAEIGMKMEALGCGG